MAARTVAGLTLPVPVAGHPALELCNTRANWTSPDYREYLVSLDHAVILAVDRELLDGAAAREVAARAAADSRAAELALGRLLTLRRDLYAVLTAPEPASAVRRLDRAMLAARRRRHFVGLDEAGAPAWSRVVDLDTPLDAFAAAAEDLLTTAAGEHVRACAGTGCGWLFTDPSHRRRWCSMQWCGNREKARRHAARAAHGRTVT
ncbi:CGNR zinc finger domain-containing protein [Georgenia sp. EYE_87]|uniref:CGNR zinc finger domain-containing protein n=1 Tax=Georgenia sp. EYE_87 TaxID=2853448 RepID=UPI002002A0E0|nr:CGNR zinc finger domain-containing protein [Georgenia sp. EYE_87]MCK6211677.1 CGNR zinc finger domain-containing protein [Georgenia sp. EYE_87]